MTGFQHLMSNDEIDAIRRQERQRGRNEIAAKVALYGRGHKIIGVTKLLAFLGSENGSIKDLIYLYLDRTAMADEFTNHFVTITGECDCGGWRPGDKAKDYVGHIIDAVVAAG